MKREIKFRVWRPHQKKMQLVTQLMWGTVVTHGEITHVSTEESDLDPTAVHIMQFTGLLDKNGKEIYEGDIINARYAPNYALKAYEIKYGINGAAFSCCREHPNVQFEVLPLCPSNSMEDIEIIGNIYENPDLLTHPTSDKN